MLRSRALIAVLVVLNAIVLLGQLWPAGAPPFARLVNIVFLVLSLTFLASAWRSARRGV